MAPRTSSFRRSTPACSPASFPTPNCTSYRTAIWPSSRLPRRSTPSSRRFGPPAEKELSMSVRANQPVAPKPRTRAIGAAPVAPLTEPAAGDRTAGRQAGPRRTAVGEHDVGLDQLLAAAASGERRLIPGSEAVKLAAALARRPRTVARHAASLAADLGRVALGVSDAAPVQGDRRFHDPAWKNWVFRRVVQSYLTLGAKSRELVDEAGLDWATDRRLRILVDNIVDA